MTMKLFLVWAGTYALIMKEIQSKPKILLIPFWSILNPQCVTKEITGVNARIVS